MTVLESIVAVVGSSAVLLIVLGFLARSLILHLLSKDVESYKANLAAEHAKDHEQFKHRLRQSTIEYEHQIALLQAKRAEVVAQLYSLITKFFREATDFANPTTFEGEPSKIEKARSLGATAKLFREYYEDHEIYFAEDLCNDIESLWKEVIDSTSTFDFWLRMNEQVKESEVRKFHEAWFDAWDSVSERAPPLLAKLKQEFRKLLGVERRET